MNIEIQPIDFSMVVSLPTGDSLIVDTVYMGCRVIIEGHEFMANIVLLYIQEFDVILGMDWLSRPCLEKGRFLISGCIYLYLSSFCNSYSLLLFFWIGKSNILTKKKIRNGIKQPQSIHDRKYTSNKKAKEERGKTSPPFYLEAIHSEKSKIECTSSPKNTLFQLHIF